MCPYYPLQVGLKFKLFEAVDGATLDIPALQTAGVISANFPPQHRGTAGQALSHLLLFETMVNGSFDAALVLEDDVELADGFVASVGTALLSAPPGWALLALECPSECPRGLCADGLCELHAHVSIFCGLL